jgi:hypothetical protein
LSPLGTDDEAAGTPASTFRITQARLTESAARWRHGYRNSFYAHNKLDGSRWCTSASSPPWVSCW